jgi:hypothetical protein
MAQCAVDQALYLVRVMADTTPVEWPRLIADARKALPRPVRAQRYDGAVGVGATQSQRILCEDGEYIVKFKGNRQGSRVLATEQVVATLGHLIGAPIPHVSQVDVPESMASEISINDKPGQAGIQHGSLEEADCTGAMPIAYADEKPNRARFGVLLVLYSWVVAGDYQWIYKKSEPHLVFSVDHAGFLPGATAWTAATLKGAPAVVVDPQLATLALEPEFTQPPVTRLRAVTTIDIAAALARIDDDWLVPPDDAAVLAEFLWSRVADTVQLFSKGSVD